MRILLPIFLLIATPVFACCPVDPDTLLAESGDEGLLNLIAGRVERVTPEFWHTRAEDLKTQNLPTYRLELELARGYAALGDNAIALRMIESVKEGDHTPEVALELNVLSTQMALALWWQGGGEGYSTADCLMIAERSHQSLPDASLYAHVIRWALKGERAEPDSYLPDFFDLRYSTNKSAATDTGELKRLGLTGAEQFLLMLIRLDAAWENFDTFYALSMVYVCEGRQNLAHYTRRRAWELHESGQHSRVPGAAEITDIRPLTVFRQAKAGVLVPVSVVSEESRAFMDTQYDARRAYNASWLAARELFAKQRVEAGWNALDPMFWVDFTPPRYTVPPLEPSAAAPAAIAGDPPAKTTAETEAEVEAEPASRGKTWVLLSILVGVLVLGGLTKMRISRSAGKLEHNETP